jgi:hypothetical protein
MVAAVGTQDAVEVGDFDGVFRSLWALLQVAGQASVAVGLGAEGRLDAPAQGQWLEALGTCLRRRHLDVQGMALGGGCHPGADLHAIRLGPLRRPAIGGRPIQ